MSRYNCIVVLGPTASGKTRLACALAYYLEGEIISADSRQVYKQLDVGTGKDLDEYTVNGKPIPYHLIDVAEPSEQFYLHQFMAELRNAFDAVIANNKLPVICGGTGLYLDALRKDFSMTQIPEDQALRKSSEHLAKHELLARLMQYPEPFRQQVDLSSKKRIVRGIEIAAHLSRNPAGLKKEALPYRPYYIGIDVYINTRRRRITERLKQRLNHGLIEEVQQLLDSGISHERLRLFGLEYKFVSHFLKHEITKEELFLKLQTAIFQFAKRQMTWFRKMEKEGVEIHWIGNSADPETLAGDLKQLI